MPEDQSTEFEDEFNKEEVPAATPEKSEAALMQEQGAQEFEDGWGMFPDSSGDGVETAPVRTGDVEAISLLPVAQDEGPSFTEAQAKAKAAGAASFNWRGRSFETVGNERELAPVKSALKAAAAKKPAAAPAAAPRTPVEALSEDEADARQLAAAPAKPSGNSPSNVWPNNRPATNIYANAGPSASASPQTQAARSNLAQNIKGKSSMAEVMQGARK